MRLGNGTLLEETDQSAVMLPAGAQDQSFIKIFFVVLFIVGNHNEAIQRAFSVGWCQIPFDRAGKIFRPRREKIRISREKILPLQGENSRLRETDRKPYRAPVMAFAGTPANRNFAQNTCDAE
jgi:hypothetical protein